MDGERFDALSRSLASDPSRRGLLAGLTGGLLALTFMEFDANDAEAKKCPPCRKKKDGKCMKKRRNGTRCAAGGKVCRGGACRCSSGTTECSGVCVDITSDPRNCGACGTRCRLNAVCQAGTCSCVQGVCPPPGGSCCPVGTVLPCSCFGPNNLSGVMTDPVTCQAVDTTNCPVAQRCVGPPGTCQACCPVGSTCETSTGTCLQ
jgi:hypothetical protein